MMEGSGEGKALYSEREEQVQNLEERVYQAFVELQDPPALGWGAQSVRARRTGDEADMVWGPEQKGPSFWTFAHAKHLGFSYELWGTIRGF